MEGEGWYHRTRSEHDGPERTTTGRRVKLRGDCVPNATMPPIHRVPRSRLP